jgi:DNA-binding SARP family transcriptional activator
MGLSIKLLGRPLVTRDAEAAPAPRGRKAWGLLAYLLCGRRPATREHLASLLFADADDPLGALRWNLAEVRRLLGPDAVGGHGTVSLTLPPGTHVDVHVLVSGSWSQSVVLPSLESELLEGMSFSASPAFDAWLLAERRHLRGAAEGALREAALARLVSGREDEAIGLAARLVAMNPFEESYQELLIRSYAAGGDQDGASRQLAAVIGLYRRELGVEPGPAVFTAAQAAGGSFTTSPVTGRAAARAQLEAGQAAVNAGAIEPGLQCLRRAVAEAHACGDLELKAEALFALGSSLVYAAQDRDEEGAAALHEVIAISAATGRHTVAASAYLILALVENLRGRYEQCLGLLASAAGLAGEDDSTRANLLVFEAGVATETGQFERALALVAEGLERAAGANDLRAEAGLLAEAGRVHFLRNDLEEARPPSTRSVDLARMLGMTSFLPYPEALLGLVELAAGNHVAAGERLEHAFALGCQICDPCWESLSGAGLGLLLAATKGPGAGLVQLEDARLRSVRPGGSVWVAAFVLDCLCTVATPIGHPQMSRWVNDLEALAGRCGMREFLAKAYLHRHGLGEPGALTTARLLAEEVDNGHLLRRIDARRGASRSDRN